MTKVVLLDLNYTLVENSEQKKSPFTRQIEQEVYREELILAMKQAQAQGVVVVLITARPNKYIADTLGSLIEKARFTPNHALFNIHSAPPPVTKERHLTETLFHKYGQPDSGTVEYFGIESNPKTRSMYDKYGIPSCPQDDDRWKTFLNPELDPNS